VRKGAKRSQEGKERQRAEKIDKGGGGKQRNHADKNENGQAERPSREDQDDGRSSRAAW
jgi:hypothetical protein